MGLEPTTLRLRVSCSTDWASRARYLYNYKKMYLDLFPHSSTALSLLSRKPYLSVTQLAFGGKDRWETRRRVKSPSPPCQGKLLTASLTHTCKKKGRKEKATKAQNATEVGKRFFLLLVGEKWIKVIIYIQEKDKRLANQIMLSRARQDSQAFAGKNFLTTKLFFS